MATLNDLVGRFQTLVDNSTTLGKFIFDDLTTVNIDRKKDYPILLLKPSTSDIDSVKKSSGTNEVYSLRFYVMDLYHKSEQKSTIEAAKWTELKQIGIEFIQSLEDVSLGYKMTDTAISTTLGHFEHNDNLMVVSFEFKLTVFNCY